MDFSEKKKIISALHKTDLNQFNNLSKLMDMCIHVKADNLRLALSEAKEVKRISAINSRKNTDFVDLYWKSMLFLAQNRQLDEALIYLEKNRDPDKRFYLPRRKQLMEYGIIQGMQDMLDDVIDFLTISMPPGTGKSTVGIYFLSLVMGWFPDEPNLASAHSGMLTRSFYEGVSQILGDTVEYTWHEIFPGVSYSPRTDSNSKEQTINLDKPKRFKSLTCRAINASLTGATRCERILYADDLCSGIEEAMSKERLDKLWQTYNTDLKTRKKNKCKEIHIQTRWSVHDVVGRLQREHAEDPRARFIAVSALNEDGESNFEYSYGVGFSKEYFEEMQNSMDDVSFKCLYMNEPVEREGLLYVEDELRRYYELPEGEPDAILAICDTKDTGKDFQFLPVAYQYGKDFYIDDCICNNYATEILDVQSAEMLVTHKVQMCQFESNAAGGRVADRVHEMVKERGGNTKITKKYTTSNKETRIIVNSPFVKEHFLFKDKSLYDNKSDYQRMMNFILSYTLAGKNKFDDVVDGLSQLVLFISNLEGGQVQIMDRRILGL